MLRKFLLGMLFCGLSLSAQGMHQEEDSAASGKKVSRTALATQEQAHVEDFTSAISCLNGREYAAAAEKFADLAERGSFEALTYFHGLSISNGSKKVVCFNGHGKVPTIDIDQKMAALGKLVYGENLPYTKGAGRRGKRKKKQVDQGIFYRHTLEEALAEYCDNEKHAQFLQKTEGAVFARMIITKAAKKPLAKQLQALRILTNYKAVSLEQGVHKFTEGLLRNSYLETKRRIYYRAQRALVHQDIDFENDPYLSGLNKAKIREELIYTGTLEERKGVLEKLKEKILAGSVEAKVYGKRIEYYLTKMVECSDCPSDTLYDYALLLDRKKRVGKARRYYKLAADKGNRKAQNIYAIMLSEGEGGPVSLTGARKYFKLAADQGLKDSQYNYAQMCQSAKGGGEDLEEALKYYELAAKQGNPEAQHNYAFMLSEGKSGNASTAEVLRHSKLAADQGTVESQFNYAVVLREAGELEEARRYYKLAAEKDYLPAQLSYASTCYMGEGGDEDLEEARKYFKLTADKDEKVSQYNYAFMCQSAKGGSGDLEEARKYYKLAADNGFPAAQRNYALMCHYGKGGDRRLEEAREYYKLAADQNMPIAQNNYACMLERGEGGDRRLEEARKYLTMAARQGNLAAIRTLASGDLDVVIESSDDEEEFSKEKIIPSSQSEGSASQAGKKEEEGKEEDCASDHLKEEYSQAVTGAREKAVTDSSSGKIAVAGRKKTSPPRLVLKFSGERKYERCLPEDKVGLIQDRRAKKFVRNFLDPKRARSLKEADLEPTLRALGAVVDATKSGFIARVKHEGTEAIFSWHKGHGKNKKAFHKGGFRRDLKTFLEAMGYFDMEF